MGSARAAKVWLSWSVATGILSSGEIAPATRDILRKQKNVTVRLGEVEGIDLEAQTILLPNGPAMPFEVDPYRRRALLLGLDEVGGILSDDADAIAAFEQRQRREAPWLQLDDGRMDRLFPVSKD